MSVPSPTSSRPSSPAPPPIPGHQAPLSSAPRVPSSRYHLTFISPPLISLLNLSSSRPVFNGVKAINAGVNLPATPPRRSLDPYKRRAPPPEFTTPLPASLRISPCSSLPLTERRHRQAFTIVARPPQRRSSPGEALDELPMHSSLCCTPVGELWRTGLAGGRAPVNAPPCPPPSVAGRSTDLSVEN
jgi:hypothetical protein